MTKDSLYEEQRTRNADCASKTYIAYLSCTEAYGICALPTTPGDHELACPTWQPNDRGNRRGDEIAGFFTGNLPELANESFIHDRDEAFRCGGRHCL